MSTGPLRAGDWVEVRPAEEILATLDAQGCLDQLPFMPEMLEYCGRRFRVYRRADKTCDTIERGERVRRMEGAVHLEGLRCHGHSHGDCQADCLLFWKEAWLRPMPSEDPTNSPTRRVSTDTHPDFTVKDLETATRRGDSAQEERFVCQATELNRATSPLRWWGPAQYLRELRSGNIGLSAFLRTTALASYNALVRFVHRHLHKVPLLWKLKSRPHVYGSLTGKTPRAVLNLEPGERVRVKPLHQILATLDVRRRNRGLSFDVEMAPYCGRTFTVKRRVERIIDERTGKMLSIDSDCIVLDGAVCSGLLSHGRLFCPRSIPSYWREIWLERVDADEPTQDRDTDD